MLQGLLDGRTNKEIARGLGISPRTVEVHRARLMRQLGARNVADVLRIALEAALLERLPQNHIPLGAAYPRTRSFADTERQVPRAAYGKMRK